MKILIIEDEIPAQISLTKALSKLCDDAEVIGRIASVKEAVRWLGNSENVADIIFMDVELADGSCFDIFEMVDVKAKVIITTAYNNYAIKAFKVNSIDYLLKPIDHAELKHAIDRCRTMISASDNAVNIANLKAALADEQIQYKKRFVVKVGDKIVIVNTENIAYFYSEDKSTFLVTGDKQYIVDMSLDSVQEDVDPKRFFRISRNCLVAIDSIGNISKQQNSRLKITLIPKNNFEVIVSRFRINDFMNWLEGK